MKESNTKKTSIVNYDNRLNRTVELSRLSVEEQNVAFSVFQRLTAQRRNAIELACADIKSVAGISEETKNVAYYRLLERVSRALLGMQIHYTTDRETEVYATLFNEFEVDRKSGTLYVSTNPAAKPFFYELEKNFSKFQLPQFVNLRYRGSKLLFRLFIENFNGICRLTPTELREQLDIRTDSTYRAFVHRLPVFLDDLRQCGYFSSIADVEVEKSRSRGSPILAFVFRYTVAKERKVEVAGQQKALPFDEPVVSSASDVDGSKEEPPFPAQAEVDDPPLYDVTKPRSVAEIVAAMARQSSAAGPQKTSSARSDDQQRCPICGKMKRQAHGIYGSFMQCPDWQKHKKDGLL